MNWKYLELWTIKNMELIRYLQSGVIYHLNMNIDKSLLKIGWKIVEQKSRIFQDQRPQRSTEACCCTFPKSWERRKCDWCQDINFVWIIRIQNSNVYHYPLSWNKKNVASTFLFNSYELDQNHAWIFIVDRILWT